jgi:DNA-directed RNA polymerase subunit RPC12/RpoP
MTKYFCDKCGKEVPRLNTMLRIEADDRQREFDLCDECRTGLILYIENKDNEAVIEK